MAFSHRIDLTVAEEFEQYVRVGFKSTEHIRLSVSKKKTEEKLKILGEIATVGKMLVQSRITRNHCRDAESGGLASYLVRVLDKVMVAAREGPLELPALRADKSCGLGRYWVNPKSTQPYRVPTQPNPKSSWFLSGTTQQIRVGFVRISCHPKKYQSCWIRADFVSSKKISVIF